jgi:hypothetical protein
MLQMNMPLTEAEKVKTSAARRFALLRNENLGIYEDIVEICN